MSFLWPLVQSASSGPAYSAAERERSREGVCLCQAALILLGALVFSSAEITGWHSETAQWEPKTLKKNWSCLQWPSLQKGDGEIQASLAGRSHGAWAPHSPSSALPLPCSLQSQFLFVRICSQHRVLPYSCFYAALLEPDSPPVMDMKGCSKAATSCTGQTLTAHQGNASHMPLFAMLQDYFTGTVRWCSRPVWIFFLYYPMTKRCGGSREKSLTATVLAFRKA